MRDPDKIDRRVMYTKMFLRESLLALMQEKPIGKITTAELCRHAQMNRNTFYSHYNSPADLLGSIEAEFHEQVGCSIEHSLTRGGIGTFLTEICQAIYDHRDLCRVLFSENGDKEFLHRIIDLGRDAVMLEWRALGVENSAEEIEMLYLHSANGAVSVIRKWLLDDMPLSPAALAEFINQTTYSGIQSFVSPRRNPRLRA